MLLFSGYLKVKICQKFEIFTKLGLFTFGVVWKGFAAANEISTEFLRDEAIDKVVF